MSWMWHRERVNALFLRSAISSTVKQNRYIGVKMCKSYFSRFRETGGRCTERLIHRIDLYFIAVAKQADVRAKGLTRDLDLPRTPTNLSHHLVVMGLEEVASNLVICSNVWTARHRNYADRMWKGAHQRFEDNCANLPLWSEELDRQPKVIIYIEGLQN
ncbi:hypothetical protein DFH29DRAFT_1015506 [Suillus ampliporus]|nr:hypothetical protein DFH29DRAFT_1015506 [Suillus ampliporus]